METTRRYIVANGKVYDERFYLALRSMLEFAMPTEPYKLLYIVKENKAGRSYLVTSHRRGKHRLIECGIRNDGRREDFMPKPSLRKSGPIA